MLVVGVTKESRGESAMAHRLAALASRRIDQGNLLFDAPSNLCVSQNLAVLLRLLELKNLPLLLEDLARPLKDHLEALLTLCSVLLEALDGKLLDAVLDLLPATA